MENLLTKKIAWQNKNKIAPTTVTPKMYPVKDGIVELPAPIADKMLVDDGYNWKDVNIVVAEKISGELSDEDFLTMTDTVRKNTTKEVFISKAKSLGISMVWAKLSKAKILATINDLIAVPIADSDDEIEGEL